MADRYGYIAIETLLNYCENVKDHAVTPNDIMRMKREPWITTCKDCAHHHHENGTPYCDRIDYGYGWKDDDFCSRAERRRNSK